MNMLLDVKVACFICTYTGNKSNNLYICFVCICLQQLLQLYSYIELDNQLLSKLMKKKKPISWFMSVCFTTFTLLPLTASRGGEKALGRGNMEEALGRGNMPYVQEDCNFTHAAFPLKSASTLTPTNPNQICNMYSESCCTLITEYGMRRMVKERLGKIVMSPINSGLEITELLETEFNKKTEKLVNNKPTTRSEYVLQKLVSRVKQCITALKLGYSTMLDFRISDTCIRNVIKHGLLVGNSPTNCQVRHVYVNSYKASHHIKV